MNKNRIVEGCPLRTVLDRLGDRWFILVLQALGDEGILRFNELTKYVEDISQKMLASTLSKLEETGLVARTVYSEVPPRVEYELTELGKSLIPLIDSLIEWSEEHIDEINSACNKKNKLS